MVRRLCIVAICLCGAACRDVELPVPPQRARGIYRLNALLHMNSPERSWPGAAIISGILSDTRSFDWRWAGDRPRFHFSLDQLAGWRFEAKVTAVEAVLTKTG